MTAQVYAVTGTPAPQGSKRHVGGGRMVEMSQHVGAWRNAVASQVAADRATLGYPMLTGPVSAVLIFHLRSPLKPRWPFPAVRPDLDKLVRSTFDALGAAGALEDDSRVVWLSAWKVYAPAGAPTGVWIHLEGIDNEDAAPYAAAIRGAASTFAPSSWPTA